VTVLPDNTRIAFELRLSFGSETAGERWVDGHVGLARGLQHPRFRRIDTISRRNHVHHFRFSTASEVDVEAEDWLREAYAVGQQRHLKTAAQRQRAEDESQLIRSHANRTSSAAGSRRAH